MPKRKRILLVLSLFLVCCGMFAVYLGVPGVLPAKRAIPSRSGVVQIHSVVARYKYGQYEFTDVAMLNGREIWAVGYDGRDPEKMYYSKDAGNSWEPRAVKTGQWTLNAITFADEQNGW